MLQRLESIVRGICLLVMCCACGWLPARAQEDVPQANEVEKLRSDFATEANRVQVSGGADGKQTLKMQAKPLLNWSNPERNSPAGGMFLWTLDGRPQVAMCMYPNLGNYDMEFQSLSEWGLHARLGEQSIWHPADSDLEMRVLENVPDVGPAAPSRLLQMRRIARGFSAKLVPPNRDEKPLRMLATPLYRYPASLDNGKPKPYVDGAVFAFVQGTDPEVLLIIEAVASDANQTHWQYGLARMSMVPMQVQRGEQVVWQTEWARMHYSLPYHVHRVGR
ncbi:hypothetical protein [Roseimaritima ulvae]|uniref:Uncharacterized protein n=1 Tax=Roseimaritima ulvae TaxID=980254 RepID=A0A5B9QX72_9BACT|nr:hypothetical protein [Roseimaritima ulvae]QEG43608.1 hypothetical protein UC8_56590 [Roseimaritima ulvae]